MTLCVSCLQAAGPDHAEEHPGHQDPARDPRGEGEHLQQHAGEEASKKIRSQELIL